MFRDAKTRTLFTFTTKDKGKDTYLTCLADVRVYFVQKYHEPRLGRTARHDCEVRLYEDI